MVVGVILMFIGFILPTLIIMQYLPSTLFLNFLAYVASFVGLVMGLLGILSFTIRHRRH